MIKALFLSGFIALFSVGAIAQTQSATTKETTEEKIKRVVKENFPNAKMDAINKTPYSGLYEIVDGAEIVYVDETATYLFMGQIIDMKQRKNVTDEKSKQLSAFPFNTLPFEHAIKIVRGSGERKIAVFEDPNCGFCKKFEKEAIDLKDVTMYVFLYPILSPDSQAKSKSIYCAANPAEAWLNYMTKEILPEAKDCENPIDKIVAFGRSKKITGTPTIIFEDGHRFPGAVGNEKIEAKFKEIYKK